MYAMPQKFIDMGMPSFWMSYVQVEDVLKTVDTARELGGIIELVDRLPSGNIALIRDSLGAGFTVYDGTEFNGRTSDLPGRLVWNELFVSDATRVMEFYASLFQWRYQDLGNDRHLILTSEGEIVSAIQQISNDIKGKHEYWAVYFGVKDLSETKQKVAANGGKLIFESGTEVLFADPDGAMFQVTQI